MSVPVIAWMLSLFAATISAIQLVPSTTVLKAYGDESLVLNCNFKQDQTQMSKVTIIRITKQNKEGKKATPVAIWTRATKSHMPATDGFQVKGQFGESTYDTYLSVTWVKATPENAGTYHCSSVGLDDSYEFTVEKSEDVTIIQLEPTTPNPTTITTKPSTEELIAATQAEADAVQAELNQFKSYADNSLDALRDTLTSLQEMLMEILSETAPVCEFSEDQRRQITDEVQGSTRALVANRTDMLIKSRLEDCGCEVPTSDQACDENDIPIVIEPVTTNTDIGVKVQWTLPLETDASVACIAAFQLIVTDKNGQVVYASEVPADKREVLVSAIQPNNSYTWRVTGLSALDIP